ncbi:MAG: acetyl-CoA carboxylase, carboxyltransferase subunit beta [Chthoniobacterales bacterium]|nr:acetyl-CoA carboxylase, carboxyltransferase subunit beta [Chthoniobacterales bacterium]
MTIFKRPSLKFGSKRKKEIPEGLWTKCPGCGELIHHLTLEENFRVCLHCSHHFTLTARERIESLIDKDSFSETDAKLAPVDLLNFKAVVAYKETLENYQKKTGVLDAVITGHAFLGGHPIGLAVMDFQFIAASMGAVVGEKITRIVEASTQAKKPVIIISASGGARMHEGAQSLMQMAKTSGALARHSEAHLPYISILTHPTTGGVTASFATLGDIILAEPKSMIGFAGPRVVRETTHQNLPPGFQTAEFLFDHGLIDEIVPRSRMRETLITILGHLFEKK